MQIGSVKDTPFDFAKVNRALLEKVCAKEFSVVDDAAGERMKQEILAARENLTSVGGIIQCAVVGVQPGIGQNDCDSVESVISRNLFAVPAVKGVEFGLGFSFAGSFGHEVNDPFAMENGTVAAQTNHNGGVLGGITTGMPIVFQTVFKPTPSIARAQRTVNLKTGENAVLEIKGRHDPCIVGRAAVVVEAATALSMLQLLGDDVQMPVKEEIQ